MVEKRGPISERLIEIAQIINKKYPAEDQEELFPDMEEYLKDLEDEINEEIQYVIDNHLEENEEDDDND